MNPPLPVLLCLLFAGAHAAERLPAFVPLPDSVVVAEGAFRAVGALPIVAPEELAGEAGFLAERLSRGLGLRAPVVKAGRGVTLALDGSLPAEGYTLEIGPAGVAIRGGSAAGVFHGVQTFLQTLPATVYGDGEFAPGEIVVPAMRIRDQPTMAWRGVMLDSARHFQPKAFILKFLDAMAAHKLNRLHWHLTDNEAWRLEIKKYPRLTEVTRDAPAYYPEEIPTNRTFTPRYLYGRPHGGGFYSQADAREIVAFAARRHIVIVPEIEMPGHAGSALTAYPEFSATRRKPEVLSAHSPDLFGVHPEAMVFLKDVLDETMDLFPGEWIHLGGDESLRNPDNAWKNEAGVQALIDRLGLRCADPARPECSEEALHGWLFNRLAGHLAKCGRRAVGWEEITRGGNAGRLDPKPAILCWLRRDEAVKSANSGYDIILADGFALYLDSRQSSDPREPGALYDGPFTASSIHRFDLFPPGVAPENRRHILGAQASLWTELMPRTDDVEYQAFPRLCALAELTWTAPERRADTPEFMRRLLAHGDRLTALGLNHRRVSPFGWSPEALKTGAFREFPVPPEIASRVAGGEPLRVTFNHFGGTNGLDIAGVELLAAGKPVAADRHAGFAGAKPTDTRYTLAAPAGIGTEKLSLRITASGSGGVDGTGEIFVSIGH